MVNKRIDLLEKQSAKVTELTLHLSSSNQSIEEIKKEISDLETRLASNLK